MKTKLAIAVSAALISSVTYANTQYTSNHSGVELLSIDNNKKPAVKINDVKAPQRYIVELESPAIAKYQGGISTYSSTAVKDKNSKLDIQSAPVQSYASHLKAEQAAFTNALSKVASNAKVERQFKTLFNGVTIVGQGLTVEQIMAIPGVISVYPETMYNINMDASLEVINSEAMWNAVEGMENAGKGIRVAVIDGGIRPENPMFSGDGFEAPTAMMPTDDYCSTVDSSFCNDKLIVARWSQPTFAVCPDEYMSPLGFGGHGTHVAGTAVGNQVETTYEGVDVTLSGVAPAAYLMAYKALYSTEDCTGGSGSNIMLMEALEHAVNDGADVINNSWGGGAGSDPASSPYKTMFEAAEAAGIVVVSAAGNDGNAAKTVGCPGCIESGITVANSTTGRYFANSFNTGGDDLLAIPGSDTVIDMDISGTVISALSIDAENVEGCDAFAADSFKDGIALISRGSCNFSDKVTNAEDAGATAVVVYNNRAGAPITMSVPGVTFPSVMISQDDGMAIMDSMGDTATQGTIGADIKRIMASGLADSINESSSRGPNGNENILKPDLAAPGTNILSAFSPDDGGEDFSMISGTSMASPHVAGAAALLSQLHPEWSAIDIKTALTSTSTMDGILDDDSSTPATPFAMGAGRMDLDAAAKAVLTFDKPSIAADSCVGVCTFTRTVYNKSDEASSWALSASSDAAGLMISPSTLELEAGASATFTVTVDSTFSEYGDWIFGNVMLSSTEGKQNAHLPLAVLAKESSDSSLISTFTTDTDISVADPFTIKSVVNNTLFENTVTLTATTPEGTKLTSKDDVSVALNGATQNGLSVDENTGVITWVGSMDLPEMVTTSGTGSYPSVAATMYTPVCADGCDEASFVFTVPAYKYNGVTYTAITMSDNGIVIPGNASTAGSWNNQELPDSSTPNNVVAPFWSDFDLSDGTATDTGGGSVSIDVVGNDTTSWVVVEWKDAQLYGDTSGDQYSFSVWFQTGDTEEVTFNYFDIPNMPDYVTIGAENIGGNIGTSRYYNGVGTSVTNDDWVEVKSTTAGSVELAYKAMVTDFSFGQADAPSLDEDTSMEGNVLDNDTIPDQKVARTQVTGDGMTAKAQRLIDVSPVGQLDTVVLVDEVTNGELTLAADGAFTYTPTADFTGTDTFSYTSTDEEGNLSTPTEVVITVNNINDAPTVSPSGMSSAGGFVVTAKANGDDIDGDALTYDWVQTGGASVNFTNGGPSILFTAPVGNDSLIFTVTASDGELTSEPGTATIKITEEEEQSSGGSMGWLTALLLPLAALRRRKH
ncbi:S8 family serine peptidase [Shewanella sp. MEBiC00475]|uniref:S8 family serine peptidase n=1 Tax=Shewanella sp. MEBiC00475 TaxID=2575361 RepID=UPI0010C00D95|nr:S8 family serine peptidase [Shewanella sp. MEBiC00475]